MTPHGAFHWNELMTRDLQQSKDFYAKTLGWTYETMPMTGMEPMTYTIIRSDGPMVGGMMEMSGPMFDGVPDHVDLGAVQALLATGDAGPVDDVLRVR